MTEYQGYKREAGNFEAPLGGAPWQPHFNEYLTGFMEQAKEDFQNKLSLRSMYGTRYTPEDDIFHQAMALGMAWRISRRSETPEAAGMFEVRLLSAVLIARHNIVPAMQGAAEGSEGRPAESFLNDLRVASKILASYTGADAEEIEKQSSSQQDLLSYLMRVRAALR